MRSRPTAPRSSPLPREQIFNDEFRNFYALVQADTAHPLRLRRLEREVRGFELLSSREKLMAGLPNYATYFGRDMLMTALLMEPVWSDTMVEHVIAAALAKLASSGAVSHEEALGGQAIRENAGEYHRRRDPALLADLQAVRENYFMVDDDFQLPVVAGALRRQPIGPRRAQAALLRDSQAGAGAEPRLRHAASGALRARARGDEPGEFSPRRRRVVAPGSWRDSRVGYAGGASRSTSTWCGCRRRRALSSRSTARSAPWAWRRTRSPGARGRSTHLARGGAALRGRARARRSGGQGACPARRHCPPPSGSTGSRCGAGVEFRPTRCVSDAVSLDSAGRPIPVMSTDPGTLLLLTPPYPGSRAVRCFALPYPVGLFVDGLGRWPPTTPTPRGPCGRCSSAISITRPAWFGGAR